VTILFLDYETYSATDIKHGVYKYCEDPTFEILMCAWSDDGENVHLALGEHEIKLIPGLFDSRVKKIAHNAPFERIVTSWLLGMDGYLPPEDFIDTMTLAAGNGYPKTLAKLAVALGAEPKDEAGTRLINLFCRPQRGKRIRPEDKPDLWRQFGDYCIQDVRTLIDVWNRLPHRLTNMEERVWLVDQRINDRGIKVDLELAEKAVEAATQNEIEQKAEVRAITDVGNPGSTQQLSGWFRENGLQIKDMKAETVTKALEKPNLKPDHRRVLELRQDLALVASKKYLAALNSTCSDGRLRGSLRFYGAHTGRWSGRGVQLHNLPRASVPDADSAILDLLLGNGADAETLKGLVRPLFVGPFSVVDFSAIEARVIAWLAGEQWMLDAFYRGDDLYVETARRLGPNYERKDGKVATLALGYQGGVNSLRVMGATGTDAELKRIVYRWRDAAPMIVAFWADLQKAFTRGGTAGRLVVERDDRVRRIILPSGRALTYRGVHLTQGPRGSRIVFDDPRGFKQDTYGGRLAENATQAVARDVLAEALVRLDDKGFPVASHVHDEVLVESEDLKTIEEIVCESPAWADGLPLDAEGFVTERYRKGD
jgi:DNA polymerase